MYHYSKKSQSMIETVCPELKSLLAEAIKYVDVTILEGHRTKTRQEELVKTGKSKTMNSKHCFYPSKAVDIAISPIDWDNRERFFFLGGLMTALAAKHGIKIRWGGDWNGKGLFNTDFPKEKRFDDLVHFELL